MSDETQSELIAIKLDSERRREIDEVKKRMEEFLREQINVTNELKLVVKGQDGLKERFEMGVAKTLKELDHKFDTFMIEWGKKQAEDDHRDVRLNNVEESDKRAHEKYDGINKGILWVAVFGGIGFLAKLLITWKP